MTRLSARRASMLAGAGLFALALTTFAHDVRAEDAPKLPSAAQTDPAANSVMQGFPPPADKTVRFNDGSSGKFPGTRWAFSHIRELGPTANVWRGEGPVAQLPRAERDLDKIPVTTLDGKQITFGDMPALTYPQGRGVRLCTGGRHGAATAGLHRAEDFLRIPRHFAEGGRARRRLRLQDLERRGAGVDCQARIWPVDGRSLVAADLAKARCRERRLFHG